MQTSPTDPNDDTFPAASVVIPVRNEERTIERCLQSVIEQDYPRDRLEILVFDGGSTDRTRETVERIAASANVSVRLFANPGRYVSPALNAAIEVASGEFLIRVDGHSFPDPNYVRDSIRGNLEHDADLAGGWLDAVGEGKVGRAAATALASSFGMGNPSLWRRPDTPLEVDSVNCGSYRLTALRAIGGFDEAQRANQDFEANYRLRRAGGRLVVLPEVSHRYVARDSFRRLARQFARYGFYKARVMLKHPASIRARHLVPATGLAIVLAAAVLATRWPPATWILAVVTAGYLLLLVYASVRAARGLGQAALLLPAAFATMHLTWAIGNLAGLVRWLPILLREDRGLGGADPGSR